MVDRFVDAVLARLEARASRPELESAKPFEERDEGEMRDKEAQARRAWGRHDPLRDYMKAFAYENPNHRP